MRRRRRGRGRTTPATSGRRDRSTVQRPASSSRIASSVVARTLVSEARSKIVVGISRRGVRRCDRRPSATRPATPAALPTSTTAQVADAVRERRADHRFGGGHAGVERGRDRTWPAPDGSAPARPAPVAATRARTAPTMSAIADRHRGADQRVPRPRDRRRPPHREHRRRSRPASRRTPRCRRPKAAACRCRKAPSTAPEDRPSTVRPASSTPCRMCCGAERDDHLHEAPPDRGDARHAHQVGVVGVAAGRRADRSR